MNHKGIPSNTLSHLLVSFFLVSFFQLQLPENVLEYESLGRLTKNTELSKDVIMFYHHGLICSSIVTLVDSDASAIFFFNLSSCFNTIVYTHDVVC